MKTTKRKPTMSTELKESIAVYGDGLREILCEEHDMDPEDWDQVWGLDDDDIEANPEAQWLIAWFTGVAEARGCLPEALITLDNRKASKARVKAKKAA